MATENIVALCDVDWEYAAGAFRTYPKADVSATTGKCWKNAAKSRR